MKFHHIKPILKHSLSKHSVNKAVFIKHNQRGTLVRTGNDFGMKLENKKCFKSVPSSEVISPAP